MVNGDTAQVLGSVLDNRAQEGRRPGGSCQWHAHQFRRHPVLRAVHHVLASDLRPQQRRRWTDVENGDRSLCQCLLTAGHRHQQVLHCAPGLDGERASDDRLAGVEEDQVEPVEVGDLLRYVGADEGGSDGIQRIQPVGQFDEVHEVGSDGEARAFRVVVKDLNGSRPRVEVHVVTTIVHLRLTIGVVEVERRGDSLNRAADQVGWDARHLRLKVHIRTVLGQEMQRTLGVDLHAGVVQ